MKKIILILLCASLLCLCSCNTEVPKTDKPVIVCSIFPQYDFVRNIVGDRCEVILLQKNGNDMHSFEPTPRDIVDISRADMFIIVDDMAQGWVNNVLSAVDNENLSVVQMKDFCHLLQNETPESIRDDHSHGHSHSHEEGEECSHGYDEHMWMSVENAIHTVDGLKNLLCERYPENSEYFENNSEKYTESLSKLFSEYQKLSLDGKRFIVADRFPFLYLANELHLDYVAAFPGCSDQTHSSFETLTYIMGEVENSEDNCIFTTEDENNHIAEQVALSTGAKIYKLYSCQSITKDQLESGESYLSLMTKNLEILKEAYK